MAIGAIVAGGKALAKKVAKKKAAAKATPKQAALGAKKAANLSRIESRERSGTTVAQDLRRGIEDFRKDAAAVTRSSDRRLARQGAAGTAATAATTVKGKSKPKKADPVASRSRTSRQRDR